LQVRQRRQEPGCRRVHRRVEWRSERLELVTITFYAGDCTERMCWVIADAAAQAEAFSEEVCRWNDTPRAHLLVFQNGHFRKSTELSPSVLVREDLDCHVDDDNRSVLLNELDGFAGNQGLLVVATTNHPEKLDRSILDRPSRFDRKFHFPMPTAQDRRAYLARWNGGLKPALRVTDRVLDAVAERSVHFSFAYLKELTLASTMAFIADPRPGAMDEILARTFGVLRSEMDNTNVVLPPRPSGRPIGVRLESGG
jgi:hypothetical protein